MEEERNLWGRPSKLTAEFLEAAESVLLDEMNAIILTDEELLILINERLPEESKISDSTFEKWKAWTQAGNAMYKGFLRLYKKALLLQKSNLFKKLWWEESNQWQRFAWIIERKFGDWNLRTITENTNNNTNINHEVEDTEDFKDILKDNWLI